MTIGTIFTRTHFPDTPIRIKDIITHKREGGKNIKLSTPIYVIEYLNSSKKDFETNLKEINNQLSFGLWSLT